MSASSGPRTTNAYAAFEPSKPWQYESRPLGAEDVEIKVTHCGICGGDIRALDNSSTPFPSVPGHEIVGEVVQAGSVVKNVAVGDRVGVGFTAWACLNKDPTRPCRECAAGADMHCSRVVFTTNSKYEDGHQSYGGFADFIRVSSSYAFPIPDSISSAEAAPLLCAGAAVYFPLKREGVKPGDRVGVVGIGGVGHIALQYIKALDAIPIAFSRSPKKKEEALALGAAEYYNLSDPLDVEKVANSIDLLLVTVDVANLPYNTYIRLTRHSCDVGYPQRRHSLQAPAPGRKQHPSRGEQGRQHPAHGGSTSTCGREKYPSDRRNSPDGPNQRRNRAHSHRESSLPHYSGELTHRSSISSSVRAVGNSMTSFNVTVFSSDGMHSRSRLRRATSFLLLLLRCARSLRRISAFSLPVALGHSESQCMPSQCGHGFGGTFGRSVEVLVGGSALTVRVALPNDVFLADLLGLEEE